MHGTAKTSSLLVANGKRLLKGRYYRIDINWKKLYDGGSDSGYTDICVDICFDGGCGGGFFRKWNG
jgi:hypothetical protein